MRAQDSPFRPYWWATGLSNVDVEARADVATYGRYPYEDLPPVPFAMNGYFDWLTHRPEHEEWPITGNAEQQLPRLLAACDRDGVILPQVFTRFIGDAALQRRIRSTTACYMDLDAGAVAIDTGGLLIRFLADQQGCLFWYLYVTEDGTDHAVVCSTEFIDSEESAAIEEPEELCFCAESFESFLCRYWLENEIWFATEDGTDMPDVGAEYIDQYRSLS